MVLLRKREGLKKRIRNQIFPLEVAFNAWKRWFSSHLKRKMFFIHITNCIDYCFEYTLPRSYFPIFLLRYKYLFSVDRQAIRAEGEGSLFDILRKIVFRFSIWSVRLSSRNKWTQTGFFFFSCVCLCVNVLCSSKFGHFISILSYHSLGSREKGGKKSIHGRRRTFSQWGHGFLFRAFWIRLAKNVDTSLRFMYAFSCSDVTRLKWPFVQ